MTVAFTTFPEYKRQTCFYLLSRALLHASRTRRSHTTLPSTDDKWVVTHSHRKRTTHLWQRSSGAVAPSQHGTFSMERVIRLKFQRRPPDGWHITVACRGAYEIRIMVKVTKSVSTSLRT